MRDFREENYYELLDVHPKANQQEVESSYRRARKIFNPDSVATYALFQPDELNLLRRRIEEAFRTLSDPVRRTAYDKELLRLEESWIEVVKSEPGAAVTDRPRQRLESFEQQVAGKKEVEEPAVEERQLFVVQDMDGGFSAPVDEQEGDSSTVMEGTCADSTEQQTIDAVERGELEPERQPQSESEQQPSTANRDEHDADLSFEAQHEPDEKYDSFESESEKSLMDDDQDVDSKKSLQVKMPVVDESTEITGALLKQARQLMGLTLDDYVKKTKISIYYLRNIENEDFTDLPAPVYTRGYLQQIAKILGLDPLLVAKGYMERMTKDG